MKDDRLIALDPVTLDTADDTAAALLKRGEAVVGFIPNMYANMANSPGLLETYMDGYARFREQTVLTPAEQEVVFLTVSRENSCHYCVPAHSFLADKMSGVPSEVTQAIRDGAEVPDDRLRALNVMVRTMIASRGRPKPADIEAFLAAGYTPRHLLDVILGIAVKTLSNYSNYLFQTELDEPMQPYA